MQHREASYSNLTHARESAQNTDIMTEENTYPPAPEGSVRLNKFLASCGYESRRAADRLIAEGRVEVNGKAAQGATCGNGKAFYINVPLDKTSNEITVTAKKNGKTLTPPGCVYCPQTL